jgi:hypothetical protein
MNSVASLFHAFEFKGEKGKMAHLDCIYFNSVQNSSGRYKRWHRAKSFQLLLQNDVCLLDFNAKGMLAPSVINGFSIMNVV